MTEVVAALIRQGDSFLICQRPAHKARALLWEFPGGKVETGESAAEALARECEEELGVRLHIGALYMQAEHRYPDIHILLSLYEATIASGQLERREHAAFAWIRPAEIPLYDFCPADEDILVRLRAEG